MAKDLLYHHAEKTKKKIASSLKEYYKCAKEKGQKGDCYTICPCAKRNTEKRKILRFNPKTGNVIAVKKGEKRQPKYAHLKPVSHRHQLKYKTKEEQKEHKRKYDKERYRLMKEKRWADYLKSVKEQQGE
jgi:hypothetical protein